MRDLTNLELVEIDGGNDNCPMKKEKSLGYYVGYAIGWLVETLNG